MNRTIINNDNSQLQPKLADYIALWLLKIAKMKRRSLDCSGEIDPTTFYEEFFEQKDVQAYNEDPRMAARRETISGFFSCNVSPGAQVLDVGCGLGDVLTGIPAGYALHGIDYAQSNVSAAQRRLGNRAVISQGSAYDISYPNECFDVCLCLEVLEHIEDEQRAVREISRVLKADGLFVVAVPYTYYWSEYLKLMGHFRHYTRQSICNLLSCTGFEVINHLPNYPNWHQKYTREYAMLRAQAEIFGRLIGRKSVYDFKWPWQKPLAFESISNKLELLKSQDASLDYSVLSTSTFVVARKS